MPFLLSVTSCTKDKETKPVKQIPVTYYLSAEDRSLFDFFYSNQTISFVDSNNNHLVFHADSLYDFITHAENDLRDGEMLQLQYSCETDHLPNYAFNLWLTAKANNVVQLNIQFATGTYQHERYNDYRIAGFFFDPKARYPVDSPGSSGETIHNDYADSLSLRGTEFYSVYYQTYQSASSSTQQTCYFSPDKGVVAFSHDLDGKFWIRE